MRRIVHWMQPTVDGCVEGPNREFDWPIVLPETFEPGVVLLRHEGVR